MAEQQTAQQIAEECEKARERAVQEAVNEQALEAEALRRVVGLKIKARVRVGNGKGLHLNKIRY